MESIAAFLFFRTSRDKIAIVSAVLAVETAPPHYYGFEDRDSLGYLTF